jgi:hypothetical protein
MLPADDEALQSDVYLELLLDSHRRGPRLVASPGVEPLHPDLRRAAQLLDRNLLRFHPSFRFEEALAARLRAAAEAVGSPHLARGQTLPFPGRATWPRPFPPRANWALPFPPRATWPLPRTPFLADDREALNRMLVGGAIASGVSIAGAAALLAWRRRSRHEVA